jgi:hypothetical protein
MQRLNYMNRIAALPARLVSGSGCVSSVRFS